MKKKIMIIVMLLLGVVMLNTNQLVSAATTEAGSTNVTIGFKENTKVTQPTSVPERKTTVNPEKDIKGSVSTVGGILPQTNEEKSVMVVLVGFILILGALLLFFIKKDKKENKG